MTSRPLSVEVLRGTLVESRHRVDAVVCTAEGRLVRTWGDADRVVVPRSAVKPVQALPLIESGAAECLAVSDEELAIACASHGGQPAHVTVVERWLARAGLSEADLACGAHWPLHLPATHTLLRAGAPESSPLLNNCSGKHALMLATAVALGEPTRGYEATEHPVQRRVAAAIGALSGCPDAALGWAVDGCNLPAVALPLSALALAAARLADPAAFGAERRRAIERIRTAMTAHPFLVAGDDRLCTTLMVATAGRVLVKTGAEGVFLAVIPTSGIGVALKVADGATRAAEVALMHTLQVLGALDGVEDETLKRYREMRLLNWNQRPVGAVRVRSSG
ncbi:MAG: asparaginase [Alphaproteobacteria bacterium]|nr:asparaginase [Alphaproteobacteria bacterium]